MNTTLLATALAASLFAGFAGAATVQIDVPQNVHPAESTLTRAEVTADAHMWRLAGLQALNQGDRSVETNALEYRVAYETYVQLRASPQFATLVQQLQQNPNSTVVASGHSIRVAQTRN